MHWPPGPWHQPSPSRAGRDLEPTCIGGSPGTADSMERAVERCEAESAPFEAAYHDCMHGAPGHADSLERWVEYCVEVAVTAIPAE
ncbi:hypothetical protein [Ilumatobacter sp.]|uniref:hypothetical protein n=1 Tax=Ilumatobacter sp. TaxID=1967498 RepID=UPI003C5B6A46